MAEKSALTIADGVIQVPGSSDDLVANAFVQSSTTKYESIWIPSTSVRLHNTSPPGETDIWSGAYRALAFDPDTEESVFTEILIPRAYVEGQALRVAVHVVPADNGSGVIRFGFEYRKANINDAFSSTSTVLMNVTMQGITDRHYRTSDTYITGSTMDRNLVLAGRLYRDATSGTDSYANDAYLLGLEIRIPVDRIGAAL